MEAEKLAQAAAFWSPIFVVRHRQTVRDASSFIEFKLYRATNSRARIGKYVDTRFFPLARRRERRRRQIEDYYFFGVLSLEKRT